MLNFRLLLLALALILISQVSEASDYHPKYTQSTYCHYNNGKTTCYNRARVQVEVETKRRQDVYIRDKNDKLLKCDKYSGKCK